MRKLGIALAVSAASLTLTTGAALAEKINVGLCVSWPGYAMLEIASQKGFAEGYEINTVIFDDPLGGHAALAAGQIDIYECTGDYTPLAIDRGTGVVTVAFANPSYGVDHVILAPDVTAENVAGKRIGAPQAYIGQLLMGVWMDSEKIPLDDVTWVNLLADEALGPMLSGDLAGAYLYEPWISRVMENLDGATSAANTGEDWMLETGIFTDVIYMNGDFIANNRSAALDMLKARFDAVGWWNENTEEGNQLMSDYLQWPVADIESVIGTNGKFLEGGIYMYDFDESARVCGVVDGEPPFGLKNGSITTVIKTINDYWVRFGLMDKTHDASKGVDCSLLADLAAQDYRQSLTANK